MKLKAIILICISIIYGLFVNMYYRKHFNDIISDIGSNIIFIPFVYSIIYVTSKNKFLFSKKKDVAYHFLLLSSVEVLSYFFPYFGILLTLKIL